MGPGCVKTRLGEGCAELFSQLASSERSCQYNRLPHRRNRDGNSTRKLDVGVFTQPGSKSEVSPLAQHVRSTLNSRHRQAAPACPFGANNGRRAGKGPAEETPPESDLTTRSLSNLCFL